MIDIKTSVYINGTNFSMYAVRPIKWGNFLDERLDEMYITLVGTNRRAFKPMDKVELCHTLHNKYRNKTTVKRMYYLVANDKATEEPVGSGHYTHELYCIELTKMLEMYIVDSLTFTNILGVSYAEANAPVTFSDEDLYPSSSQYLYAGEALSKTAYKTPSQNGALVVFSPSELIVEHTPVTNWARNIITVKKGDQILYSYDYPYGDDSGGGGTTLTGLSGTFQIIYQITWNTAPTSNPNRTFWYTQATYTVGVVDSKHPSKRLTCTDVITRMLSLTIPLFEGDTPKFVLDSADATDFDKIYCPEITATQGTLRENLQEVGKIIHGEPRLTPYGFNTHKVTYDRYGSTERGKKPKKYVERVSEQAIDSYCSSVDSSAQNLVNSLNYAQGVIVEPRANAYKTVRTETQYVRITDANMLIKTTRPIYKIIKLECGLVQGNTVSAPVDITPYVFESTIYNAQLSSYSGEYPNSKAFGLYYSIGSDSIEGLNFKLDDALAPAFERYAIVNILNEATGQTLKTGGDDFYPTLAFRVTYVPYFNVRLTQSKQYIKDFDEPAVLVYNQSANVIESRAYGENLKGVVARLGNPERSITYWITSFIQIPKAGDMYDDDYYISTVVVEMYNNVMRCTVGLSKDFNRLSAYIGVSSERRLYEVSERAAYDRTTLYKEYIVVGDAETTDNTLLGDNFFDALVNEFTQTAEIATIDKVIAWGGTYQNPTGTTALRPLDAVELPVVASALGNAIIFIWSYQDNYSAGAVASHQSNDSVSGYYQQDYRYTDYYGKMYYYNFDLSPSTGAETTDFNTQTALGVDFPGIDDSDTPGTSSGYFSTLEYKPYIYRKDSREISQFCAEVEFVTNRKDLIIGSALAARNGLVGAQKEDPVRLYFLPFKINKFAGKITEDLSDVPYFAPSGINIGERQVRQSTESPSLTVYLGYQINSNGQFELITPTTFENIELGDVYYSENADGTTTATTATQIYLNKLIKQGAFYVAYQLITTDPQTDGYIMQITEKQMILTVFGDIPACEAWAFITPQYTTTQTVEDDEGNVSKQPYYEGGEVLLACNTPVADGGTIAPIYFTAVHDPFAQFDITTEFVLGGTITAPLGYAYQRYDELINKFILEDKTVNPQNASLGTMFYIVDADGDASIGSTLYEYTKIDMRSNMWKKRTITRKGE